MHFLKKRCRCFTRAPSLQTTPPMGRVFTALLKEAAGILLAIYFTASLLFFLSLKDTFNGKMHFPTASVLHYGI